MPQNSVKALYHYYVEMWTGRVFSVESKWCGTSVKIWMCRVNGGGFGNR